MRKGAVPTPAQLARSGKRDELVWAAARVLLVRTTRDAFYGHLDPVLKADIERFLTFYPRKP